MAMTISQARKLTQDLAIKHFNTKLNIPVKENGRLTRALGRFRAIGGKTPTPLDIELSSRLLQNFKDETIADVILHELCHWYLFINNQPNADGHPVFENLLKSVGAKSTGTLQPAGEVHELICSGCKKSVYKTLSKRKAMNRTGAQYRSTCCHAPLKYKGYQQLEDVNVSATQVAITPENIEPQMDTLNSGMVTVTDIATYLKMDPKKLRKYLRDNGFQKPGKNWEWPADHVDVIKLKGLQK